ncbi:MAG TPA: Holliday junction resolvase RuvX [Vicinamibacteria bacterium]|jgi:putative Holliday junction resolvase
MRCLGLDVGDKRIGVAVSDEGALIASPRETLERKGIRKDIAHLLELARREEISEILVGMPWNLDGSTGPQAEKVLRFVEALRAATDLPIVTWDERLSTVSAERALLEADLSRRKRRGAVDRVAAALILQSYLDARRAEEGSSTIP